MSNPPTGEYSSSLWWLWTPILLIVGVVTQWIQPFRPGFDDAYAIEAAWRFANGGPLAHSWHTSLHDLAAPTLTYIGVDWPPVFALVMAGLLKVGLSVSVAVKTVQLTAALVGISGWIRLAATHLSGGFLYLFLGWVLILFFANEASVTNLVVWALMPWIVLSLCRVLDPSRRSAAVVCGILIAAALCFRYAAVYLIPAAASVALLAPGPGLRERVLRSVLLAAPPGLTLLGLFALNQSLGGNIAFVEEYATGLHFDALFRSTAPLDAWSAQGFGLLLIGDRWLTDPLLRAVLSGAFFVGMTWLAIIAWRRHAFGSTAQHRLLAVTLALYGWLVLMLAALTVRHGALDGWTFIGHARYYSELLPAIALTWLLVFHQILQHHQVTVSRLFVVLALVVASGFMTVRHAGGGRPLLAWLSGHDHPENQVEAELTREVTESGDAPMVVFDGGASRHPRWAKPVLVRDWPTLAELETLGASARTRIVAIRPAREPLDESTARTIDQLALTESRTADRRGQEHRIYVGWFPER